MIQVIRPGDDVLTGLLHKRTLDLEKVDDAVRDIVNSVKTGGDEALCAATARLDGIRLEASGIRVGPDEIEAAYNSVSEDFLVALRKAAQNIVQFHRKQLRNSWIDPQSDGTLLGQLLLPLRRVGIYVPGGKASYPSSVLMNAIPAAVAGVREIVMVTPPGRNGSINPHTLVAAAEAGVTEIYRAGGAQAIAALAYGTQTIAKVDKIVGPGNIYVTAAKRQVFGMVDIDMLAGPSEVLIIADETARPEFVAADMLAQAEHDEMASAVLVTPSTRLAQNVQQALIDQLKNLNRREVAEKSIRERGAIVITGTLAEAVQVADSFAPEHLELLVRDPYMWLGKLGNAGAIFLGQYSPEPVGDYFAGPNHVLPTGGTARFFSPLNVDTFMKKTSIIGYSPGALQRDGKYIVTLAMMEGLDAHAAAVKIRLAAQPGNEEVQPKNGAAPTHYSAVPQSDLGARELPGWERFKPGFGSLHSVDAGGFNGFNNDHGGNKKERG